MISKKLGKRYDSKAFVGPNGRIFIACLITMGFSGFALLFSMASAMYTQKLAKREFPTLVQLSDGSIADIAFEDPSYKSPAVIKSFVSNTLYYTMSQTSYGVGSSEVSALNPKRQKATPVLIQVEKMGKRPITQSAFLATESMHPEFAKGFRENLAKMTHPDVFKGTEEVLLDISRVKEPSPNLNDDGKWDGTWNVDVIAFLRVYRLGQGETNAIAFNKRVTVRAIDSPAIHSVEEFGELAVALNSAQASGLQITNMIDLNLTEVF